MFLSFFRRLHSDERGFALVISVMLLAVMTVLMVISLGAGQGSREIAERGSRYNETIVIAEAGIHDAVTRLGESRSAASPCAIGTGTTCSTTGGEYQVSWSAFTGGQMTVTAIGYYPTKTSAQVTRKVQITLEPKPTFQYALFATDNAIDIKNNETIYGDVYSTAGVTTGNGAIICGSITSPTGTVTTGNGSQILKSSGSCSGKTGKVWAGSTISNGGTIAGDAVSSAPSGTNCATTTGYQINGGTVQGNATACGTIGSTVSGTSLPRTSTSQAAMQTMPTFIFDPNNYSSVNCYPGTGTCGSTNTSATAVSTFNAVSTANMSGTYAIWQTNPTQSTVVDLDGLSLSGDLTIMTNAPVDFGNTSTVSTSSSSATLIIVSTYIPPTGTSCDTNGGDCSIYGKNGIDFDNGVDADPDDGVTGLLYTPGKMAFKNKPYMEGAVYSGSMDIKNGFSATYNSRIERILGFGGSLEQTLWQELSA